MILEKPNRKREKARWKVCTRCQQKLPLDCFHLDRKGRRADGLYPYCKDCRRAYYGQKKLPERQFRDCHFCGKTFSPRGTQIRDNVDGLFFCSSEHYHAHRQKYAVTHYFGYRKYILERDGQTCVLCHRSDLPLHVHHIVSRGAGGPDEYTNLVSLCYLCHHSKAHGREGAIYKEQLLAYTSGFQRPDFWDHVMDRSERDENRIRLAKKRAKKRHYEKIKASPRYQEYKEKQKIRMDRFKEYHKNRQSSLRRHAQTP